MNVGMLWFDNDSRRDLNSKIERAAAYYETKYGRHPTLCFVHPSMLPSLADAAGENGEEKEAREVKAFRSGNIEVRTTRSMLPNHFWIGVNGVNGSSQGA
ncbi:MAG: hypothetical protein GX495_09765 [Chloroflexi bacterium]|jgi:hypothetical protein|nr:hypothetical protein [Chloroflexota bacterium]